MAEVARGASVKNMIDWAVSDSLVDYLDAVAFMEARVGDIAAGRARELVWLLEHPPLYTAGTSAREDELLMPDRLPVYRTGRGGQFTYHGPGQRIAYVMLDLKKRDNDVRKFVGDLEIWIIDTLKIFAVDGERRKDRVGVWVTSGDNGQREDKIAALGIRLRKWISFHGVSLNVDPDLEHFSGIVPCGISDYGVTSLQDLGHAVAMSDIDMALRSCFEKIFGRTEVIVPPLTHQPLAAPG